MSDHGFADASKTNFIPTDDEVVAIKHLIAEPLAQISKLDDEIAAAEEIVNVLRRKRLQLLDDVSVHRQLISPVRRVPPDVLREIFISCLPENRNPTMSAEEAPVILTRISCQWRDIALTTPRLWAALHIPVPNASPVFSGSYDCKSGKRLTPNEVTEIRLSAVAEWISRSGTLPLDFSVHEHDGYPPNELCKRFLQAILPYRTRWRSIAFVGLTTSFIDIHVISPTDLPALETLSLNLYRSETAQSHMPLWKDMPVFQAPVIRKFSVTGVRLEISQLPFEWSQLTELSIEGDMWSTIGVASVDEVVLTLTKCPNLVKCGLHIGAQLNSPPRTDFPIISLLHLESLTIYDGLRTPNLYAALDAPKLRKLDYSASRRGRTTSPQTPAPEITTVLQLLKSVGNGLHELTITSGTFEGTNEVISCLVQCPLLTSLAIVSSHRVPPLSQYSDDLAAFVDRFLEQFVRASNAGPPICPKMEVFKCVRDVYFSDEALLDFILRKQDSTDGGVSPLKSVNVLFMRQPTINIPYILAKKNMAAGLELDLQYPPRTYRGPFSLYEGTPYMGRRDPYLQPF